MKVVMTYEPARSVPPSLACQRGLDKWILGDIVGCATGMGGKEERKGKREE